MGNVLFTSWDNDLWLQTDIETIPRVGEYVSLFLPEGEEYRYLRVARVRYEYSFINPHELMVHVYLQEEEGDPPFLANQQKRKAG